ncbi:MAG: DUF721 domain-containing protein [Paramuribaculum sp.]|nr:DUF721 domain-containing protein [Paramuribaculum sp.]MDE7471898.1 DUF721 domain-containing protein [Paramuribaculum sp.]
MKRREAKSVREIIEEVVARAGLTDVMASQRACYMWADVVGAGINRYTSRRYVEGDVLHVFLTSAVVRSDLMMFRDRLLAELNRRAGASLKEIRFH